MFVNVLYGSLALTGKLWVGRIMIEVLFYSCDKPCENPVFPFKSLICFSKIFCIGVQRKLGIWNLFKPVAWTCIDDLIYFFQWRNETFRILQVWKVKSFRWKDFLRRERLRRRVIGIERRIAFLFILRRSSEDLHCKSWDELLLLSAHLYLFVPLFHF